MLDPANDIMPPPSSPSISSVSSSDLDTESTGSFFHDRSTTLGTLMGVSFPSIAFRAPSQHREPHASVAVSVSTVSRKTKKARKKKNNAHRLLRWWSVGGNGGRFVGTTRRCRPRSESFSRWNGGSVMARSSVPRRNSKAWRWCSSIRGTDTCCLPTGEYFHRPRRTVMMDHRRLGLFVDSRFHSPGSVVAV